MTERVYNLLEVQSRVMKPRFELDQTDPNCDPL